MRWETVVRYTADTRLTTKQVMEHAVGYFGPDGRTGLAITERGAYRIVFAGGGGYVIATTHRTPSGSRIELEVQEFDQEAQAFLGTLPGPEGWLRHTFGRSRD
jgi:hypothetical protein